MRLSLRVGKNNDRIAVQHSCQELSQLVEVNAEHKFVLRQFLGDTCHHAVIRYLPELNDLVVRHRQQVLIDRHGDSTRGGLAELFELRFLHVAARVVPLDQ